ncbi:MAG: ABC transporter permease [Thermoflexales bacterium]|nr:ABC transporter permease [Thermoflexales bacterium]MCS7325267.1 ABC transporter permease [Thermoflexales bacterium]MCX7939801.1 ABC transporter permease [Thermoflexales bacterium]MDW8053564.1 ABC transporter permease [Anaerolineae bacterium]MDW8292140.1 ABC transporter permease [Anaerolineae bacterium]
MEAISVIFSVAFVAAVLRVSTPLILPALGGLISELGGVINIALEGIMLVAACAGVLVSVWTQSAWLGAIAGVALGMFIALVLAFFHLNLKADLILAAIALNLLASGGTIFVVYLVTGDKSSTSRLVSGQMPFLSDFIPSVRELGDLGRLLDQNILTYAAFVLTALVALFLYRTRTGIHLRAVGENPEAARSVGINVRRMQYLALLLSGMLAALGGVYLSMGYVKFFARDMTGGRGFIALAAIYLGARKPLGVLIAALVFGAAEALSIQLGNLRVPTQLVQIIPYFATLAALVIYAVAQRQRALARQRAFLQSRAARQV